MDYSIIFVCLMGIGTVFVGLICLILLTMLMGRILSRSNQPAAVPAPVPAVPAAPEGNREELVAAISSSPRKSPPIFCKISCQPAERSSIWIRFPFRMPVFLSRKLRRSRIRLLLCGWTVWSRPVSGSDAVLPPSISMPARRPLMAFPVKNRISLLRKV